jgi:hypothetical protein
MTLDGGAMHGGRRASSARTWVIGDAPGRRSGGPAVLRNRSRARAQRKVTARTRVTTV